MKEIKMTDLRKRAQINWPQVFLKKENERKTERKKEMNHRICAVMQLKTKSKAGTLYLQAGFPSFCVSTFLDHNAEHTATTFLLHTHTWTQTRRCANPVS